MLALISRITGKNAVSLKGNKYLRRSGGSLRFVDFFLHDADLVNWGLFLTVLAEQRACMLT